MSTTPIQTYTHTVQRVNQRKPKLHWVRVNREEVRIQKTRGRRRRSAGGTGGLANFLRHVCLSMCVLPSQAVLPCNCSKTQPIIFTQLHFFPLRPSKCIEKEWERDRAQEKQKEAERESHMQLRVYSMNEWMYMRVYEVKETLWPISTFSTSDDVRGIPK